MTAGGASRSKARGLPACSTRLVRRIIIALALITLCHGSVSADRFVERPDDEILLLSLRTQGKTLADTLPAWPTPGGGVMLPLGEVARLLTLAIEVDVSKGTAGGFIITEDRPFHLDARSGRVLVRGRETGFEPRLVEVQRDDIYVDAATLSSWIPVDLNIDLRQSLVTAVPREPLPFMLAAEREGRLDRAAAHAGTDRQPYPVQPLVWSLAGGLALEHQSRFNASGGDGRPLNDYQQTTFFAGDLLRQSARVWMIGSDTDPLDEIRATIGRRHPEPGLLGFMHAREYAAGEVFMPGDDLLMDGGSGPGLLLSNYPLRQTNQFDTYTIEGIGPAGWDVELYQNDALLTISHVGLDGRYEFSDVPLYFGLNVFRLVFYGPQGQIREESRRLNIAEALAKPGELNYRVSAADVRARGERSELEADWGMSERVSMRFAMASGDFSTGRDTYVRAGFGAYQGIWYGRLDAVASGEGGTLIRGALQTRLGNLSVTGELALLNDFKSETFLPKFGLMDRRARGRIDGILPSSLASLNFSLDATVESFASGGEVWTLGNRLSKQFGRTFLTHNLTSRIPKGLGQGFESNTTASLIGSRFAKGMAFRGEVAYQIEPDLRLTTASLQVDSYRLAGFQIGAGLQRIEASGVNRAFGSISRTRGPFSWGVSGSWDDRDRWTITAGFGVSAIHDAVSGTWETSARSLATQGAASLRVFVDRDQDGAFSEGDEPLENIGFFVDRVDARVTTDGNGLALVTGLATEAIHSVSISNTTLEDFLMVPAKPGVTFYVRLGHPTVVELPVEMTGEVYGTVNLVSGDRSLPGSGLTIVLVGGDGTISHETTTAYDGFYELVGIRPGTYKLEVGEKTRGREIARPEPLTVVIPPDGATLDGVDLVVREVQ